MARKRCSKCKKIKLSSYFTQSKDKPDGLADQCKECKREYERNYKREWRRIRRQKGIVEKPGIKTIAPATGIESLDQIDSVIRELAELQTGINYEKLTCKKRIDMVREYTKETIEPWLAHQIVLRTMLLDFLKKNGEKTLTRKYRFGSLQFSRGKLKLRLNTDLAKQRIEKP